MDAVDLIVILTRLMAAVIWTHIAIILIKDDSPALPMVRALVMSTLLLGLWFLVIGAFVTISENLDEDIQPMVIRWLYTVYTAFASIVGLAILSGPWRRSD